MLNLLKISPEIIEFPAVLQQSITTSLRLENVANRPVAFKIKVTAPKSYLVRPSTGVISRDKHQDVQIILQPLSQERNEATDRFLVQATPCDDDATSLTREFWGVVPKSEIYDQRLNVAFKRTFDGQEAAAGPEVATPAPTHPGFSSAPAPKNIDDLTAKYEASHKKCAELEEENLRMQKDLVNLRQRFNENMMSKRAGEGGEDAAARPMGGLLQRIEIWHAIPILILIFIIVKLMFY